MELRGFWCGTEGFLGLKRCGPKVEQMCGTEGYSTKTDKPNKQMAATHFSLL